MQIRIPLDNPPGMYESFLTENDRMVLRRLEYIFTHRASKIIYPNTGEFPTQILSWTVEDNNGIEELVIELS